MSWTQYARRTPVEKTRTTVTYIVFFAVIFCLSYATLTQPQLREKLPSALQAKVLEGESLYRKYIVGDIVVLSKQIDAQRVLKKKSRVVHYKNGFVGHEHSKHFLIKDRLHAEVEVETLPTLAIARRMYFVKGGGDFDQLDVGSPSGIEIHGLDNENDYYIQSTARTGRHIVTVRLEKKLTSWERQRAVGSAYNTMMENYANRLLTRLIRISKAQVKRVSHVQ